MNFTAIDFETATADRASACSVGLVVVRENKIVKNFSSLIRPPNLEFSPKNISIHGIAPEDVADKPTFQELWPKFDNFLCDELLVAHSAAFDMSVLRRCLEDAKIPCPKIRCACTVAMARELLPGLPNHKLVTLSSLFGIDLDHHKAEADAVACAHLAILLGRLAEPPGILRFARDLSDAFARPEQSPSRSSAMVCISIPGGPDLGTDCMEDLAQSDAAPLRTRARADKRFRGLSFVFTGELQTLTRENAVNLVSEKGGHAGNSVSRSTDCVVVGDAALDCYKRTGHTTGKLAKAVALQTNGEKVRIISETEFLTMIQ